MLPFRSGRSRSRSAPLALLLIVSCCFTGLAGTPKSEKRKPEKKTDQGLASIPLPIGQEAKGMILPDIDPDGRLRGRFEAATVKRLDDAHVQFGNLKMLTFKEDDKQDLEITMPKSVLDLNTRILSSADRTSIKRIDFELAGDRMQFNTTTREGTLAGNVKMVLFDSSRLSEPKPE